MNMEIDVAPTSLVAGRLLLVKPGGAVPESTAPPTPGAGDASSSAASFDPVAATRAYLATVAGEKRARSDAYFEGGYWLQLWDFLLGAGVDLGAARNGPLASMRDLAERLVRFRPLQTFLYWVQYLLSRRSSLFPMTVYEGFFREHKYGLATQTFGAWLGDQAKGLGVGLVLGGLAVTALYGVVRRLAADVVALGGGRDHRAAGVRRADRARLHRAALQQVHAARRPGGARADPEPWPAPTACARDDVWSSTPRARPPASPPTSAASPAPSASASTTTC